MHQEITPNQQRVVDKNIPIISKGLADIENDPAPLVVEKRNQGDDAALNELNQKAGDLEEQKQKEETEPTEKELTFWSGFIDSLSMIFFVEFGDRVSFIAYHRLS